MKKEQLAFVVVVLLMGTILLTSGDDGERRRRRRGRGQPTSGSTEVRVPEAALLVGDTVTWSPTGRNVFLAPKDTVPLPPIELGPPPLPRLPHPGLALIPAVGGEAATGMRHDLVPDPSIKLPEPGAAAGGGSEGGADAGSPPDAPGNPDSQPDDEGVEGGDVAVIGELTLAQRLSMKMVERLRREELRRERAKALEERRSKLDIVLWKNGLTSRGRIAPESAGDDIFLLKKRIDRLRGDASLGDDGRRKELRKLRFAFWEDRGAKKAATRAVLTGEQVQGLQFSNTPLNRYRLQVIDTRQDDLDRQLDLASLVFGAGEYEVAATHLERMLAAGLKDERIYAMLSDCHRHLFNYDRQLVCLTQGIAGYERSVDLRSRLGLLYLRLNVPELAERTFQDALQHDRGNALANLGLGEVLVGRQEGQRAIPFLSNARSGLGLDRGQRMHVGVLRGRAWLQTGDLDRAAREFNALLDLDPTHAEALGGLAAIHLARGEFTTAQEVLQRALSARSLDGRLRYLHGVCLLRLEQWGPARDALMLALDLDPLLTAPVRTAMSYLMEKLGQDEAALAEADLALVADPTSTEAHLQRGRVLLSVGDLEGSRSEFLLVLESRPDRPDVLVVLGDVAFLGGDVAAARRYYERAAAHDAGFPYLDARTMVCDVKQRRFDGAEKILGGWSTQKTRDAFIQSVVAYYHFHKGNRREAQQRLARLARNKEALEAIKTYASVAAAAIDDNLKKELWRDNFNRRASGLVRGWKMERGSGIAIVLKGEHVVFRGSQKKLSNQPTVLYQRRSGRELSSFSADLDMKASTGVYTGVGLMAFTRRRVTMERFPGWQERDGGRQPNAALQVALSPDGNLVYRVLSKFSMSEWKPVPDATYRGGPVTLGIRVESHNKERFAIMVNNQVALGGIQVAGLGGRGGRGVELQVFSQAVIGRPVGFTVDDVRIVTIKK